MVVNCPACGKTNTTEVVCTRCGCDLSALRRVLGAATNALETAKACLRAADWSAALAWALESWQLRHSIEASRLAFLAASASANPSQAVQWHRRGQDSPNG